MHSKLLPYIIGAFLVPFLSFGQFETSNCPMEYEDTTSISGRSANCFNSSTLFTNYYDRYEYYKDIYDHRNDVIIPIDIHVWQKDDSTGNFQNNPTDKSYLQNIVNNANERLSNLENKKMIF